MKIIMKIIIKWLGLGLKNACETLQQEKFADESWIKEKEVEILNLEEDKLAKDNAICAQDVYNTANNIKLQDEYVKNKILIEQNQNIMEKIITLN